MMLSASIHRLSSLFFLKQKLRPIVGTNEKGGSVTEPARDHLLLSAKSVFPGPWDVSFVFKIEKELSMEKDGGRERKGRQETK